MGEIVLTDVQKVYPGGARAVEKISYTIQDGHFVTLLGPSGCGKTTTLNMIAGLEDISSGSIMIDGRRVDELAPDKRDLAFVFQDYALYPHMSVYQNMAFGLRMRKVPKDEINRRVHDAAARLSIEPFLDRRPKALSGGQRQRVALGRAIARRPSVFLFDEPLSNLDALLRDQTRTELKQLHQDLGATSVYVTHDQEEALTLSDRIVVMSKGHLEQYGTPQEIYDTPASEFVASFVGKPRMNMFTAHREGAGYRIEDSAIMLPATGTSAPVVRAGLRPDEIDVSREPGTRTVPARVRLVEPLGHATDVFLAVGALLVTARVPGFYSVEVGDEVHLDLRRARIHLFAVGGGARLN